jgi:hypothetical protein
MDSLKSMHTKIIHGNPESAFHIVHLNTNAAGRYSFQGFIVPHKETISCVLVCVNNYPAVSAILAYVE